MCGHRHNACSFASSGVVAAVGGEACPATQSGLCVCAPAAGAAAAATLYCERAATIRSLGRALQ